MRRRVGRVLLVMGLSGSVLAGSAGQGIAGGPPFIVNTTRDTADSNIGDGVCDTQPRAGLQCTLRAAIQEANEIPVVGPRDGSRAPQGGETRIHFNIVSATDVKTISPTRQLPPLRGRTSIEGYAQPGSSRNTLEVGNDAVLKIQLNGTNAGGAAIGLRVQHTNFAFVRGLIVNRFGGSGIEVTGERSEISGNFIGTSPDGTQDLGNGGPGLTVSGPDSEIGGTGS